MIFMSVPLFSEGLNGLLRFTVKILVFLRLTVKILAILRLTVNFFPLLLTEMLKINFHCFKKLIINFQNTLTTGRLLLRSIPG